MSSDQSILFANNLSYKMPVPVSVATDRVIKRQYFQNTTYSEGQTAICTFNTGNDYISLKDSSLVVKVRVVEGAGQGPYTCSFGSGSALNLFRNQRIYHRSGTCYSNAQKINLWSKIENKYTQTEQWLNTVGEVMGYNMSPTLITNLAEDADSFTAVIPLNLLHPFFAPMGDVMLPASMAAGLRWEADLASLAEAFVVGTGTTESPSRYVIDEIYFETMSVSLMDSAAASLNSLASKQALEFIYNDIFTSINTAPSQTTAVNIDVNKSVAYAQRMVSAIQDTDKLTDITQDSFDMDYRNASWWLQLGSNHYPSNVKVDKSNVAYKNALLVYDKLKHPYKESSVTLQEFNTTDGIYGASLERDTALALSAQQVNSSRSLRFEVQFDTAPVVPVTTTCFLTYLTSARTTLTSSKVDI